VDAPQCQAADPDEIDRELNGVFDMSLDLEPSVKSRPPTSVGECACRSSRFQSQSAAMAKAKISLKAVVERSLAGAAGFRAVSVVPNLKDVRPVASVMMVKGEDFKIVNQPLE
jgi:hypothetical protein